MGGDHHGPVVLKRVWTPSGGPHYEPPAALARTRALYFGALAALALYAAWDFSRRRERRPVVPYRPIPSQRWATHTLEDDPNYYERRAAYHAHKRPLWRRLLWLPEDEVVPPGVLDGALDNHRA